MDKNKEEEMQEQEKISIEFAQLWYVSRGHSAICRWCGRGITSTTKIAYIPLKNSEDLMRVKLYFHYPDCWERFREMVVMSGKIC